MTGARGLATQRRASFAETLIALGRIEQDIVAGLDVQLAEDGLTADQWLVLETVATFEGATMGEIAESLSMANSSLSRTVDALEDSASVYRSPDPADRRRLVVRITRLGTERLERARALVQAWERPVIDALGERAILNLEQTVTTLRELK